MADLKFFMDNFDKLVEDARVQVESLSHDLKDIPQNLQNVALHLQEQAEGVKEGLAAALQEISSGELLRKDYRPELQKVVEHLEMEVDELFSRIKSAIDKAK